MKKITLIFALLLGITNTYAQSWEWIYAPDQKMESGTGNMHPPFSSTSDIVTDMTSFLNNREGVYTNIAYGEFKAFNEFGFYNINGDRMYDWGSDNLMGVPGRCDLYFSLRWTSNGAHTSPSVDVPILFGYEWDAALDTFMEVSTDTLFNRGGVQRNHAIGGLSAGGRRYIYIARNNVLDIFHITRYGNIVFDHTFTLPYQVDEIEKLQMEVTPDNESVIMLLGDNNLYKYDRISNSITQISSNGPGLVISGIEVVPYGFFASGGDRLYVSRRRTVAPLTGGIVYYDLSASPGTAPTTVSSDYSYGHSELERAKDGYLYFARYIGSVVANPSYTSNSGELYRFDPVAATIAQHTPSVIPINSTRNINGYLIQNQIDANDYNYECFNGCNSAFTFDHIIDPAPGAPIHEYDFYADDAAQPMQYEWFVDGVLVGTGIDLLNYTLSSGCHEVKLVVSDGGIYNRCEHTKRVCTGNVQIRDADDLDGDYKPCTSTPTFRIKYLSNSRIEIEPSYSPNYYYITWGDGSTPTYHTTPLSPVPTFHHSYTQVVAGRAILVPAQGNFTVCLQTGHPGQCRTCYDVYVDGWEMTSLTLGDPEKPAGIANSSMQSAKEFLVNSLSPNPAVEHVNVDITSAKDGQVSVVLYDMVGRLVQNHMFKLQAGSNVVNIPLQGLNQGMYMVEVSNESGKTLHKVIKN